VVWSKLREKFSPRPEQHRGIELILRGEGARILLHPGKGKTATVLKAFCILKAAGHVDKLVVFAPLRVITTSWPAQLSYWEDFAHLTYTVVHGDRRARMLEDVDVYLVNYEGLLSKEWVPGGAHITEFLARGRYMLACDESTKLKNSASRRFKNLKKLLHHFWPRVIMTGTPKPNHLEDLFAQCYVTDRGADLGQYVTAFRSQYMMRHPSGFGYAPQPGAAERLASKIAPTTLQLEYEEAVPSQVIPIWVPMPASVKPFYDELKKEMLSTLGDDIIMAPNAGVLFNKLRQVCQGALYTAENVWQVLHDAKLDALENIISELDGEPVLVMYQYKHDLARIQERLGYEVPHIGSGVSATQGAAWCKQFSAGDIPVLLGHPQSIAHGVDGLQQSCSNVVWFGLDQSWENTYQGNLRVVRSGSKAEQVYIYQIMVECATERSVLRNVSGKQISEAEFCRLLREELVSE